ncbi:MAG: M23 family metallopeptidase [Burkholderiaceae bacterium]|nr:MAG: M23 family metallopeptidase [Burkholderiaceae bacterium]
MHRIAPGLPGAHARHGMKHDWMVGLESGLNPGLKETDAPIQRRLEERFPLHWRRHLPVLRRALLSVAGLFALGTVAALAIAPQAYDAPPSAEDLQIVTRDLSLPATLPAQLEALGARNDQYVRSERVRSGDTIAALLARMQVQDADLMQLLARDPLARPLVQLRAGRTIQLQVDDTGHLSWLRYNLPANLPSADDDSASAVLQIRRQPGQNALIAEVQNLAPETRTEVRVGVIRNSLYGATDEAGIPDAIANQMAEILSGEIDFHRDLRKGDSFRVVYETLYQAQSGEDLKAGRVLALEFNNDGQHYQAIRFGNDYYTADGKSLRKEFLRCPLPFTRVTSGFSMRLHPILNTWRAHKGVDYGAPTGTPIRAVADATVEFAGVKGGYGNAVVLRHNGTYSTVYGHMSRFAAGIKRGTHVSQSQVIGYVGMTGWATGPHLHYEFLVDGVQRNPLKISLPPAKPLAAHDMPSFRQAMEAMQQKLNLVSPDLVADGA